MSSITLRATIVPGTGSGADFEAYNCAGNTSVFREIGSPFVPGLITFGRTEPKPTKDYSGVSRGNVKLTRQFTDALGISRPAILKLDTSLPAFLNDEQRIAFVEEAILLAQEPTSRGVLALQIVPQS